jgi:hypothetical protein
MGGEFMVLGFLAFTIWTCNQQNVFDEVAEIDPGDIRLPSVGADYLHLMEEVHFQLFVAMILYFALCFVVVLKADARIKEFEWCRSTWVEQLLKGNGGLNFDTDPKNLLAFKFFRTHFLDGAIKEMLTWQNDERLKGIFE